MKAWLLVLAAVVVASIALAYLATDDAFRNLWFPKLAEAAGLEASAEEATWDPLSGFTAKKVKFSAAEGISGEIDEIQASWNPTEILRATVALNSLSVSGARVDWRTGKRPIVATEAEKKEGPKRMGGPTVLGFAVECGPVALRNIDIVMRSNRGGLHLTNHVDAIELTGWRPGAEVRVKGRVGLAGSIWKDLELEKAGLSCDMRLTLNPKMEVNGAQGWVKFGDCRGRSGDMRIDGLEIEHTILLTPYWLRSAVVTATMNGRPVGRAASNGQVDFNLKTCDVVLLVEDIGPELVSAITASRGLFMTAGHLRITGQYQVLKTSQRLQGDAEMKGACFDRKAGPSAFPPIEGRCAFAAENFPGGQLVIERAQVSIVEGDSVLAAAGLDRPMKLSWAGKAKGGESAELALRVPETDMRRVAHFVEAACGARVEGGTVGGKGRITATSGGRVLSWEGSIAAKDMTGEWRGQSLEGMTVTAESVGRWRDGTTVEISNAVVRAEGPPEKRAMVSVTGGRNEKGDSWKFEGAMARDLLRGWARGHFVVSDGSVEATAELVRSADGAGQFSWKANAPNLTAEGGIFRFQNAGVGTHGKLSLGPKGERTCHATAVIRPGGEIPQGEIVAEGPWRDADGGGRLDVQLRGWNDRNLRSVLGPKYYGSRVISAGDLQAVTVFERRAKRWAIDGMAGLSAARLGTRSSEGSNPTDLVLALKGGLRGERLDIDEGSIVMGKVGDSNNSLSVAGALELGGPGIDLKIHGRVFDPSILLHLVGRESRDRRTGPRDGGRQEVVGEPAAQEVADAGGAEGAAGRVAIEIERLPIGEIDTQLSCEFTKTGSRWRQGDLKVAAGGGNLQCKVNWPKGDEWAADVSARDFPAKIAIPFVGGPTEYLDGIITGEAHCSGERGWRLDTLDGLGRFSWAGVKAEKFPPIRSFLKTAAKRVTQEIEACQIANLSGGFAVADGDWQFKEFAISGDLVRLWFTGAVKRTGRIEGETRFAGKTDMMQRSRLRLGTIEVGGATFVAFGKTEGDFTILPGALPVNGDFGGDLVADWDGWLRSAGLGALSGLIQKLNDGQAEQKKER